jgi:hypothetical protein
MSAPATAKPAKPSAADATAAAAASTGAPKKTKRKSIEELESEAKRLRSLANDAEEKAAQVEEDLAEAKRRAAEKKAPIKLSIGMTIECQRQTLGVNVFADGIDDEDWEKATVQIKDNFYWGTLSEDGPLYLIEDDVGDDGYGSITIHRNGIVRSNVPLPTLLVRQTPCRW